MTGDCRHCETWKGCPGKEWYSYAEIRWCGEQVFFILKFAEMLRCGIWPNPEITVAAGNHGPGMNTEAAFTKAIRVISEVDVRLCSTGWRGRLLCEECINREKMMYLSDDAKAALYYVSGWKRKQTTFREWRNLRRRSKNDTQMYIKAVA